MRRIIVCEKQDDWSKSLTEKLCRLFSVRLVDDLQSIGPQVCKRPNSNPLERASNPHIVIDLDKLPNSLDDLRASLGALGDQSGVKIVFSQDFTQHTNLTNRCDEFFLKPIEHPEELRALVNHIIVDFEGLQPSTTSKYSYGNMEFCFDALQLRLLPENSYQSLPPKEARLLKAFLEKPEKTWTREELTKRLWGQTKVSPRNLDSHVSRLRKRLAPAEIEIESQYGGGYCLR